MFRNVVRKLHSVLNISFFLTFHAFMGCNPMSAQSTMDATFQPGLPQTSAGPAAKLAFIAGETGINTGYCTSYTIESQDENSRSSPFAANMTVNLTSSADGPLFFSDSDCTTAITSTTMTSASATATVYVKTNLIGSFTLTAAASGITSATIAPTATLTLSRIDHFSGQAETGGYVDGSGTDTQLALPMAVATDGTNIYTTDYVLHCIRKTVISTGVTTTLAGRPGTFVSGTTNLVDAANGADARFLVPYGIVYDPATAHLYVVDYGNSAIRKVHPTTGATTTIAGAYPTPTAAFANHATGTSGRLSSPLGITVLGGTLYVADYGNHRIRTVSTTAPYALGTLAGSGTAGVTNSTLLLSRFRSPGAITHDGTHLYVADSSNHMIRRIDIAGNAVTTIAGSTNEGYANHATGTSARFYFPRGILFSNYGGSNVLYVTDYYNQAIRRISLTAPYAVTTFSGNGTFGSATDTTRANARYAFPHALTSASLGASEFYVADSMNRRVQKLNLAADEVTTLVGKTSLQGSTNGTAAASSFRDPWDMVRVGNDIYIADYYNHCIRKLSMIDGSTTTYAGSCSAAMFGTYVNGTLTAARFNSPRGIAYDGVSKLYVSDFNGNRVRVIDMTAGTVSLLAGIGTAGGTNGAGATVARFSGPSGLALNADKTILYVADANNYAIRAINLATAAVSTFVGTVGSNANTDGTGAAARFWAPLGLVSDGTTYLYVADGSNHNIRRITMATGVVTTLAGPAGTTLLEGAVNGTGTAARFFGPYTLTYDGNGSLYVADRLNGAIRKINTTTGAVTTFAGVMDLNNEVNGIINGTERLFLPYSILYTDSGIFIGGESNIRWIH
jgi:DNA-binding beta-propeller fold protein YncE